MHKHNVQTAQHRNDEKERKERTHTIMEYRIEAAAAAVAAGAAAVDAAAANTKSIIIKNSGRHLAS